MTEALVFLCAVLFLYGLLYKKAEARNTLLFISSLVFYGWFARWLVLPVTVAVAVNYGLGIAVEKTDKKSAATLLLWLGIVFNVSLLVCIKYLQSFIPSAGIAFFSLLGISYLADIKRGETPACRNFTHLGLYLCFFPKAMAGPLVKAQNFLPQLQKSYMLSTEDFSRAAALILLGLIKKTAADFLAFHFVNPVLSNPHLFTGLENWAAVYGYAVRIYLDFSGYSDMAVGVALLFDIHLPANFRSPYKAASLTDFWHRWHITLSQWLKDYVYIPLGGNRHGLWRMCIAVIVTMTLSGFWHGYGAGFVIWGIINGIILVVEKLIGWDKWINHNRFTQILGWLVCFHLICFSWIFFQAPNLENARDILWQIAGTDFADAGLILVHYRYVFIVMAAVLAIMLFVKERQKQALGRLFYKTPLIVKFIIAAGVLAAIMCIENIVPQEFIYF